ncbi:MAG: hypothetical protein MIO93_12265, partial [ANME-2 cluster archaeon]|nr:hypothetical protein [ANME-2 cluster archaeon]
FGSIDLGADNELITTPTNGNISVTVIANGDYGLESKSGNWANGSNTATLATLDSLSSGQFNLENDGANSATESAFVGTNYTTITDYSGITVRTSETGDAKPVYVWVSLAETGLLPGTYLGTYYAQIING